MSGSSTILNPLPERLGAMRAGALDTRGDDLTLAVSPVSDSLTSVSITVARRDGVAMGANDLTVTPPLYPPPWITGFVVNWWQSSGAAIARSGPVDYQITITAQTAAGRIVVHDLYQLVTAALG
jgi:hypothetical protein